MAWILSIVVDIHTAGDFLLRILVLYSCCAVLHAIGHSPPINALCPTSI